MDIGSLFSLETGPAAPAARAEPVKNVEKASEGFQKVFDDGDVPSDAEGEEQLSTELEGGDAQSGRKRSADALDVDNAQEPKTPADAERSAPDQVTEQDAAPLTAPGVFEAAAGGGAVEKAPDATSEISAEAPLDAVGQSAGRTDAAPDGDVAEPALSKEGRGALSGAPAEAALGAGGAATEKAEALRATAPSAALSEAADDAARSAAPAQQPRRLDEGGHPLGRTAVQAAAAEGAADAEFTDAEQAEAAADDGELLRQEKTTGVQQAAQSAVDRPARSEGGANAAGNSAAARSVADRAGVEAAPGDRSSADAALSRASGETFASADAPADVAPDDPAPGAERREARAAERAGAEVRGPSLGAERSDAYSAGGNGNQGGENAASGGQQGAQGLALGAGGGLAGDAAGFEQALLENTPGQANGLSGAATRVDAAGAAQQANMAAKGASVAGQIGAAILSRGDDRRIVLQLDPQELGRVSIELTFADDALSVSVRAERSDALDLMRRHADDLERQLRDAGLDFDSLSFGGEGGRGEGFDDGEPASAARDGFAYRGEARLSVEDAGAALQNASSRTRAGDGWSSGVDLRV